MCMLGIIEASSSDGGEHRIPVYASALKPSQIPKSEEQFFAIVEEGDIRHEAKVDLFRAGEQIRCGTALVSQREKGVIEFV